MKKYQTPQVMFLILCEKDVVTASDRGNFGIVFDWENEGDIGDLNV